MTESSDGIVEVWLTFLILYGANIASSAALMFLSRSSQPGGDGARLFDRRPFDEFPVCRDPLAAVA